MAELFEVEPTEILRLALFDIQEANKTSKKKSKGK